MIRNRHLTQVALATFCLASLALPADAAAACNWSPTLTMTPASGSESHGFDFTWVAVPTAGDCASFTIDHYRVVLKEGSYPTGPSNGRVFGFGTSTSGTALPHRAEREFYARLFACDNSDCSDVFGNVAGEVIDTDAADDAREIDTTDPESWETGTSVVEVYFEGDSTVVDHDCIANVDAFVHVDGGPMEGMFFYLAPSDGSFEDGYCDQGSDYSGSAYSNIYFAELQN